MKITRNAADENEKKTFFIYLTMRFKINLQINGSISGTFLPLSYQYPLSAWIYSVIAKGDAAYSAWLHDNGFLPSDSHKQLKLFIFSNLKSDCAKPVGDRLSLLSDRAS
jgi:CRISPR-associated endoribonuclease Cas6